MSLKIKDYPSPMKLLFLLFSFTQLLREEAMSRLDEEAKNNAEKIGKLDLLIAIVIEEIIGEKLKTAQDR